MVITQTPYRISFFGGGTDYPEWYKENGWQVLSTTVDKYLYMSCRYLPPFFEHRLRLVYSSIELCNSAEELKHPSAREVLQYLNIVRDVEVHYDGDLPGRSGMGSSSAFTVGLLHALYAFIEESVTPERLARESIHIEQNLVRELVGSQDQVSAAYGGFNKIKFLPDGEILVHPISVDKDRLNQFEERIMLFFTGIVRTAESVAGSYAKNIKSRAKQLCMLYDMVDDGVDILSGSSDLDDFGRLLHEGWMEKRSLSTEVSNFTVDEIYRTARSAGALGGKLAGAGGGGILVLYVPLGKQQKIKRSLSKLANIPIKFEPVGSRVIFKNRSRRYVDTEIRHSNNKIKFVELDEL